MKKRILSYVVVFLVVSVALTGCTDDEVSEAVNELVEEANYLYEEESEYKEAIEIFGDALEKRPTSVEAYQGVLNILLDKGYLEKAENIANEASLRVSGEDAAQLFLEVGKKYYDNGDYEEAGDLYDKGAEQDRSHYLLNLEQARLDIMEEDIAQARSSIDNIHGDDREGAEYLLLKAYLEKDNWDDIRYLVDQIDTSEVDDDDIIEQVENLEEVYNLDDDEGDLYKVAYLSREYINWGYPYLAISLLTSYEEDIQEYWEGQYYLGKAYFDHGDIDNALEYLGNAETLGVEDSGLDLVLARAYFSKDDVNQSLNYYEDAISQKDLSERSDIAKEYVQVLLDANMISRAENTLTDIAGEEEHSWVYILLCQIAHERDNLGKLGEYIEILDGYDSLELEDEVKFVRYNIYYAMEKGEEEKVETLLDKYEELDEFDPELYLLRAKFLKNYEENSGAVREPLYRAIELDLDDKVTQESRRMLASIE